MRDGELEKHQGKKRRNCRRKNDGWMKTISQNTERERERSEERSADIAKTRGTQVNQFIDSHGATNVNYSSLTMPSFTKSHEEEYCGQPNDRAWAGDRARHEGR